MRQAILAAEDSGFFEHFGLSITGLVRAVVTNVIQMRKAGGASTLTQQLARKLFLTDEKTWERKIKEPLLSIQIEKRYTKEEIFTLYCNQMYFGHGAYGVEAASQLYFGKPAKDLVVEEAATDRRHPPGERAAEPVREPERRRAAPQLRARPDGRARASSPARRGRRRQGEADRRRAATRRAKSVAGALLPRGGAQASRSALRRQAAVRERPHRAGPPLDVRLQAAANRALDAGLRRVDKRRGASGAPTRNVIADGADDRQPTATSAGHRPMAAGDIVPGVVERVDAAGVAPGHARCASAPSGRSSRRRASSGRAARTPPQLVKAGDLIDVELLTVDGTTALPRCGSSRRRCSKARWSRSTTTPARCSPWSAATASQRSKFNRATQAYRQIGSTVQADPLHRGHRPRSHAGDHPRRRADDLRRRRRPAAVRAAQLRPQVRRRR